MHALAAALTVTLIGTVAPAAAQSPSVDPRHPNFAYADPRLDTQRADRAMQACREKAEEVATSFGYDLPVGEPAPDGRGLEWTLTGADTDVAMTCRHTTAGSVRFDARYKTTPR